MVHANEFYDVVDMIDEQGEGWTQRIRLLGIGVRQVFVDGIAGRIECGERVQLFFVAGGKGCQSFVIIAIEKSGIEIDLDHSPIFSNGLYLIVFQVAEDGT